MNKKIVLTMVIGFALLMSACSQKVGMKALEPAQIDRVSNTKKITVTNFKNDRVGLSKKIEANLAQFSIDEKKYFTLVSRNDFEKIIKEQRIQNSGLIDPSKAVEVGQLIGAQAIISGNVGTPSSEDSYVYEKRSKCADKECKKLVYYKVRCVKRVVGLSSEVRIVDVSKGDIIFADTLSRTGRYKHCSDDQIALPSKEIAAQNLAASMAREFSNKLTPHYRHFKVALLEDPDLDYSDKQEELLEVSLEYIEASRYDKAENLLKRLVDSTDSQSYVPFYNLGVISEARGNYEEAKEYYSYADNIMVQPVDEINEAVVRIDKLIIKRTKTREQINR
ncbi:MAG: CsgG/HfaB family protein [Campylobacterota bacterium]|nr:CsgG/HfaB family protein [Campylobacterota bacterium]